VFKRNRDFNTSIIGKNISKAREKKGYTQDEFANLLGTNRVTVSKWETCNNVPSTEMLFQITNILDVSIDELLGLKNESQEKRMNIFKKILLILLILLLLVLSILGIYYFCTNYKKTIVYSVLINGEDVGMAIMTRDTFIIDCPLENYSDVKLYYLNKDDKEELIYHDTLGRLKFITYLGYNEYFDFNDFEYLKNNLYITYIDGKTEKREKIEFNLNYINDKFKVQKENEIALSEEVTQNIISDDLTEKIKKCFDKTDGGYLYVYTQKNVEHRIDYVEEDNLIVYLKKNSDKTYEYWALYLDGYLLDYIKKNENHNVVFECSNDEAKCNKKVSEFYELLYKTFK